MEVIPHARYSDVTELKTALIECTEEVRKKRQAAVKNIRRVSFILAGSILMLAGGIGFRIADNVKNNQSYDSLIKSAQSESGDTAKKIEDAIAAIDIKPYQLEPYEALRNLYESDYKFTVEEEAKFQAVITPNKDELSKRSGYSDFAYQVGIMYLIYYTESSESYIKAIDWFSAVDDDHKEAADVYLRIGQFDRDITKKLSTGDESGAFKTQWDSLNEGLSLAGRKNNDLLLMAICKKVISAMDEYCMKFKKDGISRDEMEATLQKIEEYMAGFIPNTEEYLNDSGEIDFTKYYETLKQETEQSENGSAQMNGTDALFVEIYPFLSTLPVEIEKTYR
ncbi:MAG: hypothetical protein K2G88_04290 [Oscillospiraceae bacterium]|nr:hypothetical protein [Oscillospiraceae bacterium]